VRDSSVLDSMRKTPRDRFVSAELVRYAYDDRPLPIGYGQTISQPYIVAKMTELLEPKREHQVLEIGSGSGYQAAVLSPLVAQVYTIEIIEPLGIAARQQGFDQGQPRQQTAAPRLQPCLQAARGFLCPARRDQRLGDFNGVFFSQANPSSIE